MAQKNQPPPASPSPETRQLKYRAENVARPVVSKEILNRPNAADSEEAQKAAQSARRKKRSESKGPVADI
jgi:hypothetical protein